MLPHAGADGRGARWRQAVEETTRRWISRHFPDIFDEILFGNHYGVEGKKRCGPSECHPFL